MQLKQQQAECSIPPILSCPLAAKRGGLMVNNCGYRTTPRVPHTHEYCVQRPWATHCSAHPCCTPPSGCKSEPPLLGTAARRLLLPHSSFVTSTLTAAYHHQTMAHACEVFCTSACLCIHACMSAAYAFMHVKICKPPLPPLFPGDISSGRPIYYYTSSKAIIRG